MADRVLLDTSVWVDFFRADNSNTVLKVSELLKKRAVLVTGIILFELLQGARDEKESQKLQELLEPLDRWDPDTRFWQEAGKKAQRLRRKGLSSSTVDLIIALVAIEADAALYSHDKHFKVLAKHLPLELIEK